jgi:hypothetical protein
VAAGTRHVSRILHQELGVTVSYSQYDIQYVTNHQVALDVIDNFPDVEDFSDLPKAQLCSSCLINKYAAMQQNAYGVYDDENWKPRYEIIVKCRCNNNISLNSS